MHVFARVSSALRSFLGVGGYAWWRGAGPLSLGRFFGSTAEDWPKNNFDSYPRVTKAWHFLFNCKIQGSGIVRIMHVTRMQKKPTI